MMSTVTSSVFFFVSGIKKKIYANCFWTGILSTKPCCIAVQISRSHEMFIYTNQNILYRKDLKKLPQISVWW